MQSKQFYKSKTMWVAFLLALLSWLAPTIAPGATDWVQHNPDIAVPIIVTVLSAIFAWLRKVTKGRIDFGFSDA